MGMFSSGVTCGKTLARDGGRGRSAETGML